MKPINRPFSVTYNISFAGRTKSDGYKTVTSGMIRDKLMEVLERALREGNIQEYKISAEINEIEQEEAVRKSITEGKGEVHKKK